MNEIVLKEENGKVLANSREVAEKFGKRHSDVIRSIKTLLKMTQRKIAFSASDGRSIKMKLENLTRCI